MKKGFTLVELLAVIVILGILMLIAVPSVQTIITNTRKKAFQRQIQLTVENVETVASVEKSDGPLTPCWVPFGSDVEVGKRYFVGNVPQSPPLQSYVVSERGKYSDKTWGVVMVDANGKGKAYAFEEDQKFWIIGGTSTDTTVLNSSH